MSSWNQLTGSDPVHWLLDSEEWYGVPSALGRHPGLWRGVDADPADARALAELAASLVAYNVSPNGRVTPRSTYRGFGPTRSVRRNGPRRWRPHSFTRSCTASTTSRRQPPASTSDC
ncbi:MAG: hypothetical protein ACXWDE_05915 [Aeromicrobium sp.]